MLDQVVSELASRQYGCFSRLQALGAGADDRVISRRLAARRWLQAAPGVYALAGCPGSWLRQLWIAYLDVGPHAVVSHEAAARLHRLPLFAAGPRAVLTVPHGDHERPGPCLVHQSTDLRPEQVVSVDGLPVTSIPRTYADLAAISPAARFERSVDMAASERRLVIGELAALYQELSRPGKRGMKLLGHVVGYRGAGYVPPNSELERWMRRAIELAGVRQPRFEAPLPWRPTAERRVDGLWEPERVIVEGDGRRWHERRDAMLDDRRRDRDAQNHQYRIYRFLWEELRYGQEAVAQCLREALGTAAA